MSDTINKKFEKAYSTAGGKSPLTIPWTLLFELLQKLLAGLCLAKDIKELTKKHPIYVRGRLRREMLRNGKTMKEAGILADAAVETINKTSVADLTLLA